MQWKRLRRVHNRFQDLPLVFRERVAAHYKQRGYTVHQAVKVRGRSDAVHAVDMVAQGAMGNLVVSFGDEGGIEGPELSAIKRAAKDIGAAAVIAVEDPPGYLRRMAATQGIRVLDQAALEAPPEVTRAQMSPEALDHPWPEQSIDRRRAGAQPTPAAAGLWTQTARPAASAPPASAPGSRFAWLQQPAAASGAAPAGPPPRPARQQTVTIQETEPSGLRRDAPVAPAIARPPQPHPPAPRPVLASAPRAHAQPIQAAPMGPVPSGSTTWRWVLGPVIYGVVTGLVLFLFVALFL